MQRLSRISPIPWSRSGNGTPPQVSVPLAPSTPPGRRGFLFSCPLSSAAFPVALVRGQGRALCCALHRDGLPRRRGGQYCRGRYRRNRPLMRTPPCGGVDGQAGAGVSRASRGAPGTAPAAPRRCRPRAGSHIPSAPAAAGSSGCFHCARRSAARTGCRGRTPG
jgi:hypothetical protein